MNESEENHWEDYEIQKPDGHWTTVVELLKEQKDKFLVDLYRLRANIPLTQGSSARRMAKELIEKYG